MEEDLMVGGCTQQYQQGKLSAFANFSYSSDSPQFEVDIFSLIQSQLVSSNDSIVRIENDGSLVGLQPGESVISAGVNVAPLTINVSSSPVTVQSISVLLTTGISLILPSEPYDVLSVLPASVLLLEDFNVDRARVHVIAGIMFSDETHYLPTSGIIVRSLNQSVVAAMESVDLTVQGSGTGYVEVIWLPQCSSPILASTTVSLVIDLPDPSHVEIILNTTRISLVGSLASQAGISVAASVQAYLVYPDGARTDVSTDGRLQLDLTQASNLITTSLSSSNRVIITVNEAATSGIAIITATVTGHSVTTLFNIIVVEFNSLSIHATPYPVYDGSNTNMISHLYQIANTGMYQQAMLHMLMILSDNSSTEVQSAFLFFESSEEVVRVSSNMVTGISPGSATIRGSFGDQSTLFEIEVTEIPVVITEFTNFTLGTDTLSGIKDLHTAQLHVSALFNDSTTYNELVVNNRAMYPGLLAFASSMPSAALVNQFTGVVTLRNNHYDLVTVTVQSALSTATSEFRFACNLLAEPGDVDAGSQTGIPVPPQTVRSSFILPIYVNTGGQRLRTFDLRILADFNALQLQSVTQGTDFVASLSVNSNQDSVDIIGMGVCGTTCDSQELINVANLNVTATTSGIIQIEGLVISLSTDDAGDFPLNGGVARVFTAGKIQILVVDETNTRKRRLSSHNIYKRQTDCQASPICSCIIPGDLNRDCVVDASDALFLLNYLAEETYNFELSNFTLDSSLLDDLDVDQNGAVDLTDAYVLERVSLNLLHLLTNVTVIPTQSNQDCTLVIGATFVSRQTTSSDLLVFFDISLPFDRTFMIQQQFDDSVFLQGQLVPNSKSLTILGGVISAAFVNQGQYIAVLRTNLTSENISLSVIQVNPSQGPTISPSRVQAMFGFPDPPFKYPQSVEFGLPISNSSAVVNIPVSNGFNPFTTFDNQLSNEICVDTPPPVFSNINYTASVDENQDVGTMVITVTATTVTFYAIRYSIVSGNELGYFAISDDTGIITTNVPLDAESNETVFLLTVAATLVGTEPNAVSNASVFITVTSVNEAPEILAARVVEIDVTTPVNTTIVSLIIIDPDTFDASYSELDITNIDPPSSLFILTGSSILVNTVLASGPSVNYTLTIQVTDAMNSSLSSTTSITVLIVNITVPLFDMEVYTMDIPQSTEVGTTLASFILSSPFGSTVNFTISNFTDIFDINANQLLLARAVNVEEEITYEFSIDADVIIAGQNFTASVVVQVNVFPDLNKTVEFTMELYISSIPEGSENGTIVLQTIANISNGSSASFTYSLNDESVPFAVNNSTGVISVTGFINYESDPSYSFDVVATLPDSTFDTAMVIVNITNVNDNPPVITAHPSVVILSNISQNIIAAIQATDADGIEDLRYSVENNPIGSIDEVTGDITTTQSLSDLARTVQTLIVEVTDGNFTDSFNLTVVILDPVYNLTLSELHLPSSTQSILLFVSEIVDDIMYTSSQLPSMFEINSTTGMLYLSDSLDFETTMSYQFTVNVTSSIRQVEISVDVSVVNENDNAPIFSNEPYSVSLPVNSFIGIQVIQLNASDADQDKVRFGINSNYSFIEGIDRSTGIIITTQCIPLSLEDTIIILPVNVTDGMLSATTVLTVNITSPIDDTSCAAEVNITSEIDIEYSINGGGFLVSTDERLSRLMYSQRFSFLSEEPGILTARVGGVQDSIIYQPQRLPAEFVSAVLLNDAVFYDDPVVQVALQVRDARYSINTLQTTVQVLITHPTSNNSTAGSCTPRAPGSTCIASASIPSHWFITANIISVQYGITNQDDMFNLGTVQVFPVVNYTANYTVVLTTPARPLYRGQRFTVPIVAHAGFAVRSFQLLLRSPVGISIGDISVDVDRWSLSSPSTVTNTDGSTTTSFAATLHTEVLQTISREPVNTATNLARVMFTVQQNAMEDTTYLINCTVVQLANILETILTDNGPPTAVWITRNSVEMQIGSVFVASDPVIGLFAYSSQSEIINTGASRSLNVNLITAKAEDGLRENTPMSCNSSNSMALSITSNCRSVTIGSSQTEGSSLINISLFNSGYEVNLPFRVWFPTYFTLQLSDNILSPITGWLDPEEGCAQVYQRSMVRIECRFTDGEMTSSVIDVTEYYTGQLQVLNTTIASYQDGYIFGITPGNTTLVLQVGDQTLASIEITVAAEPVEVIALDTAVVASLSLTQSTSTIQQYDTHFVNVSIQDELEFEGALGDVAVAAIMSDSNRFLLNNSPGLLINSLDMVVFDVTEPYTIRAKESGNGELLQVNLTSGNCSAQNLVFTQNAFVNISLPLPVSSILDLSSTVLTKESDAATMVGLATSISLRTFLVFPDGRRLEMTSDNRTRYNSTDGLNITVSGTVISVRANADASGSQAITVTYTHVELSSTVLIDIVQALDIALEVHPFPLYPGSNDFPTTVLYPIANTSLWEQAIIFARLELDDSSSRDISTNSRLQLSLNETSPVDLELIQISRFRILNINSATANGYITIMGVFGNIISSTLLKINISTIPIFVRSIDSVSLVSGRDYITGIKDLASDQVIVSVTFNDSTRYINLFSAGIRQLPQLLQFSTSNASILSVGQSSGRLLLRANSHVRQTITCTAGDSNTVSESFRVACNLAPDVGDVDLGKTAGLPLDPLTVGSAVSIPLFVNAGSVGVASLDIDIFYPPDVLEIQRIELSSLANRNPFVSTLNDPPGIVSLGGTLDQTQARGTILIATLNFRVMGSSGTIQFTGMINEFRDINGTLIGNEGETVAGNIMVSIVSSSIRRKRARIDSSSLMHSRKRRVTCDNPPCSMCPNNREIGDINFDCVLNVQDVTFSRIYITEAPLNFTGSLAYLLQDVTDAQRAALDSDQNGVIDIDDAFYLLRVIFRLLRFVGDRMVISQPPECGLQVSFTLYSSGNTLTDGSDAENTFLGLLVAGDDEGFQQVFDNESTQRLPLNTNNGLFGGLVNATYVGNGTFSASFGRDLAQYGNIGVSLVQLTVDDLGNSNLARQEFLRGIPQAPYMYTSSFRVDAEIHGLSIILLASNGYNPLFMINSSLSEVCSSSATVAPTTMLTTTLTTTTNVVSTVTSETVTSIITSEAVTSIVNSEVISSTVPSEAVTSIITSEAVTSIVNSEVISSTVASEAVTSITSATVSFVTSTSIIASSALATSVSSTITPSPTIVPDFPPITPVIVAGTDIKLVGQTSGNLSTNYTQEFGLLAASSENIDVNLGGYTSRVSIEEMRKPATRFRASVLHHDNRVWQDGRTVPVVFQVHDEDLSNRVQVGAQVNMTVTLVSSGEILMHSCTPNDNTGMCTIDVTFPLEWFDDMSVQHANLTYMTSEPILIATLQLKPYVAVNSVTDQVVVEVPSRTIFPGDTFVASVCAYNSFSITGFN